MTAASCLFDYGSSTRKYPGTNLNFFPAKLGRRNPFLGYKVVGIAVPQVWKAGNDQCTVAGVKCANNLAVIRLAVNRRRLPGERVGFYAYGSNNFAYTSEGGTIFTQMTSLGYAGNLNRGNVMMRTDGPAKQLQNNLVEMGSTARNGIQGSPMIVNFGAVPVFSSSPGVDNDPNVVMGVVGYFAGSNAPMLIGGSRFGNNPKFPGKTNIQSLVDEICGAISEKNARNRICGDRYLA